MPWGRTWPSRTEFATIAATRRVTPVVRRVLADAETPLGVYRKLADTRSSSFLLESAEHGGVWSRYSFVGASCPAALADVEGRAEWLGEPPAFLPREGATTDVLRDSLRALATPHLPGLPPLTGGFVGMLAYDAVRAWEGVPDAGVDALGLPDVLLLLATDLAVLDHFDGSLFLIANVMLEGTETAEQVHTAYDDAVARIDTMTAALAREATSTVCVIDPVELPVSSSHTQREFEDMVEAGKEHIRAGDVFQIVLAQRFSIACPADSLEVYRALRLSNPSPYMYLLRMPATSRHGAFDIVGSSPEALVRVTDRRVITHPIAGSRPRGDTPAADVLLAEELLADEKERAEHVMLVDLSRNDLQRVCRAGSVDTVEFMAVRRYSHIMHLESTVVGELRDDLGAYEALSATFPAGTLTGAPKPRAMALIDEYEHLRRGLYGGVVGYFDFAGDLDMAIAIRTAVIKDGVAHVQAGAGIVADSVPSTEYVETCNKAAAALRAVAAAAGMRAP